MRNVIERIIALSTVGSHQHVFLQGSDSISKGFESAGVRGGQLVIRNLIDAVRGYGVVQKEFTDGAHCGRACGLQQGVLQPSCRISVVSYIKSTCLHSISNHDCNV